MMECFRQLISRYSHSDIAGHRWWQTRKKLSNYFFTNILLFYYLNWWINFRRNGSDFSKKTDNFFISKINSIFSLWPPLSHSFHGRTLIHEFPLQKLFIILISIIASAMKWAINNELSNVRNHFVNLSLFASNCSDPTHSTKLPLL